MELFDTSLYDANFQEPPDEEVEHEESAFIFSTQKIESDLMYVLKTASVTQVDEGEWHIDIKDALDRRLYNKFKKIMPCIRCKWNGKTHIAGHDPQPLLNELIADGRYPEINPHSFFPTPHDLIDEWLTIADFPTREDWERWQDMGWHDMTDWMVIGDLTAGTGHMLQQAHYRVPDATYEAVELDPTNRKVLEQFDWLNIVGKDIFQAAPELTNRYDWLLFNPPFSGSDYCKFIEVALTCLKPNGRAIFITPPNLFFGASKAIRKTRNTLAEGYLCWHLEKHPGFPIDVVVTVYTKPDLRQMKRLYEENIYGYKGWETYAACLYFSNESKFDEWLDRRVVELVKADSVDSSHLYADVAIELDNQVNDLYAGRKEYSRECPPPITWNEKVKGRCVKHYLEEISDRAQWTLDEQKKLEGLTS